DLNLAAEYCERLILLKEGRVFQKGSPQKILTYKNIEEVYKTLVVVEESPISSKPHVFLISGRNKRKQV
ncbi:ABC transporter, partial [bacterium]|nr:ABC transporter [bacterium]